MDGNLRAIQVNHANFSTKGKEISNYGYTTAQLARGDEHFKGHTGILCCLHGHVGHNYTRALSGSRRGSGLVHAANTETRNNMIGS